MKLHAFTLATAAALLMIHSVQGQMTHLSYEVDTCFYANLDPTGSFDPDDNLPGNSTYRFYAHFMHPGDQLQAVYALGLGSTLTSPWVLDAPCGCFEHPFGTSIGVGNNPVLLDAFPDLAFDSYFTMDLNPGTTIAGGIPVLGGAPDLPAVCNTVLEDAAMYVLGGVFAGSDLRVFIGQVTTCGPLEFSACFQVQQINGTLQNWCASDVPDGPLAVDPPCAPWATYNTELMVDPGTSPVEVIVPWASAWPVEVEFFDAATGTSVDTLLADSICFPAPGTYFAALKDANTCRDTTPVFCVPEPFYTCDGECVDDADGDGVCDPLEVPGCFNPEACNYEPAATDLVPCVFPEPGYDCNGDCLADGDGDGICDPFEIPGCMGIHACNFNPEATDDDGSCTYLPTYSITGPSATVDNIPTAYAYPADAASSCFWTVEGGGVLSGQGNAEVEVTWPASGAFEIVVQEYADTCTSAPVTLMVEVGVNGIERHHAATLHLAHGRIHSASEGTLQVWDIRGRLLFEAEVRPGSSTALPPSTVGIAVFTAANGTREHLRWSTR